MASLAENPINDYYLGMPCSIGEVVGRIIGADEDCQWAYINESEEKQPSIILVSTPHGSVIKSGRFYIGNITEEKLKKLWEYENMVIDTGDEIYEGKLKDVDLKKIDDKLCQN